MRSSSRTTGLLAVVLDQNEARDLVRWRSREDQREQRRARARPRGERRLMRRRAFAEHPFRTSRKQWPRLDLPESRWASLVEQCQERQ